LVIGNLKHLCHVECWVEPCNSVEVLIVSR